MATSDRSEGVAQVSPDVYLAQFGRRRPFLSQSDADAYDQGFLAYSRGEPSSGRFGPQLAGWLDAEISYLDALDRAQECER
jgi:hypothetical protein